MTSTNDYDPHFPGHRSHGRLVPEPGSHLERWPGALDQQPARNSRRTTGICGYCGSVLRSGRAPSEHDTCAFTAQRIGSKDGDGEKRLNEALAAATTRLKEGIKLAGEVEQRRDQLVHSRWFINSSYVPEPGKMTRTETSTKSGTVKSVMQSESLEDLNANTENARKAQLLIGGALRDYAHIVRQEW